MPKIKKQNLKEQFTLRIYNQEDKNLLDKVYDRNKSQFDNISDFIRHCVIIGAKKLLGDNEIDQTLNLQEIKEILQDIQTKLYNIKGNIDVNHFEQKIDNNLIEKFLNYVSNVVYNNNYNKEIITNLQNGLFNLSYERLKVMGELND